MKIKSVKQITDEYKSFYAASKGLGIAAKKITAWANSGAIVDKETGDVYIKTKGKIPLDKIGD